MEKLTNDMQIALYDLVKAQVEFERCEAIVILLKNGPREQNDLDEVKPPSWTYNESLDMENAKVFKKRKRM